MKSNFIDKIKRLNAIVEVLQFYGLQTKTELLHELKIIHGVEPSERTLDLDIQILREEFKSPIRWDTSYKGYSLTKDYSFKESLTKLITNL